MPPAGLTLARRRYPDSVPAARGRPSWRRLARIAFVIAALAAVALAVVGQWSGVSSRLRELAAGPLLAAFAMVICGLGLGMLGWRAVLADLGSPLPLPAAARTFFVGQLGKYLPGSVWPVVAQMELAQRHDVPRRRVAAATLVSLTLAAAAGLAVAAAFAPFLLGGEAARYAWILLTLPAFALVLHPRVLNAVLARGLRLVRRPADDVRLSLRGVTVGFAFFVAQYLLYGLQAWLLAVDLGAAPRPALPLTVGAFALATAAGLLFVVAPAGAGVREVVLVLALAPLLSTAAATVLALVSRLLLTLADVAVAALGWAAVRGGAAPRAAPTDVRPG